MNHGELLDVGVEGLWGSGLRGNPDMATVSPRVSLTGKQGVLKLKVQFRRAEWTLDEDPTVEWKEWCVDQAVGVVLRAAIAAWWYRYHLVRGS